MAILSDGVKKLLLAGVGAIAVTAEKSEEILDELVKKGELTVEQGKELNEELKHNKEKTVKESKSEDDETAEEVFDADKIIAGLSKEELETLKAKLNASVEEEA